MSRALPEWKPSDESGSFTLAYRRLRNLAWCILLWDLPAGMASPTQPSYESSDCRRSQCDVLNFHQMAQPDLLNPVQSGADGTAALAAIWIPPENARFHSG